MHAQVTLILFFLFTLIPTRNEINNIKYNPLNISALDKVGYTQGQFSVNAIGAAQYSIPILLPPGTAGMKPELTLSYNSSSGDGIMGLGWSLRGLSLITRSNRTLAKDGIIHNADLSSMDTYSLDGERLVLVSSDKDYGEDGAEYRTEQNIFSRIVSYGSINNTPVKFKVWTKSGLIMEYGYSDDSRIEAYNREEVLYWSVCRISDTYDNYINIEYDETGFLSQFYPKKIAYTGNSKYALEPYIEVDFQYNLNRFDFSNQDYKNIVGERHLNPKILTDISISTNNEIIRSYSFSYGISPKDEAYLTSVTECGTSGGCLNSTNFKWNINQDDTYKFSLSNSRSDSKFYQALTYKGDWDGDGISDLLLVRSGGANYFKKTIKPERSFSPIGNIKDHINLIDVNKIKNHLIEIIDFNNDGYSDLITIDLKTGSNNLFLNIQKEFGDLNFAWISNPILPSYFKQLEPNGFPYENFIRFADFNADGFVDIFSYAPYNHINDFNFSYGFHINNGPRTSEIGFGFQTVNNVPGFKENFRGQRLLYFESKNQKYGGPIGQLEVSDFNNDGLADIALFTRTENPITPYEDNGLFEVYYNINTNGTGSISFANNCNPHTPLLNSDFNLVSNSSDKRVHFGDFNGDGFVDLLCAGSKDGKLFENTGQPLDYWRYMTNKKLSQILKQEKHRAYALLIMDWNSDGKDDLIFRDKLGNDKLYFYENLGDFRLDNTLYIDRNDELIFGNFFNDSSIELLLNDYDNSSGNYSVYHSNCNINNFITSIEEGHGKRIEVNYKSMTDAEVYKKYSNAVYPLYDFVGNMFVVQEYSISNGIGGSSSIKYKYEGAKFDLNGRGFRGFSKIVMHDNITSITTITEYWIDHRVLSTPIKAITKVADVGRTISTSHNLPYQVNNSGDTIYPYVNFSNPSREYFFAAAESSQSVTYDPYTGKSISLVKTKDAFDFETGNLIFNVIDYGEGRKDSIANFYDDDFENWHLGRLIRTELYRYMEGKLEAKRVSSFEYNNNTGALVKEILEPDLDNKNQVVTEYNFDEYGNKIKETLSYYNGRQFEKRNVFSEFDGSGRFKIKTWNDLHFTTTMVYDHSYGYLLENIDPNGLKTVYEYDEFGRAIYKKEPDGTWEKKEFVPCETCPEHAIFYTKESFSNRPEVLTYYDLLGREVRSVNIGFSGKPIYTDKKYNKFGLLDKESNPYFSDETPQWNEFTYDIFGREIYRQFPAPNSGNDLRFLSTQYRDEAKSVLYIDSENNLTEIFKNVRGEIIRVQDDLNNEVIYNYDIQGNLIEIIDPAGNMIQMTYDIFGNRISLIDADIGTFTYKYNSLGELIEMVDSDGDKFEYYYDVLGRQTKRVEPEGETLWEYDTEEYGLGLLSKEQMSEFSKEYHYDEFSRLKSTRETIEGNSYQTYFEYDNNGRLAKMTYPYNSYSIKYDYNNFGYLHDIREEKGNNLIWKAEDINAKGQLVKQLLGDGSNSTFTYDSNTSELVGIRTENYYTGETIQSFNYEYDLVGNLVSRSDLRTGIVKKYKYDDLYRLILSTTNNKDSLRMIYDNLGNILFKSDVGSYKYGERDTGPHTLTSIDNMPNVCVPSIITSFEYYSYDKVKSIRQDSIKVFYKYKSDRNRFIQYKYKGGQIVETKYYIASDLEVIKLEDKSIFKCFIKGAQGILATKIFVEAQTAAPNDIEYWHKDHLGSIDIITNENGEIISDISYSPWGERHNPKTGLLIKNIEESHDRGFSGHEHIDDFGLINMNGRIYDPALGRFTTPDPFIQNPYNLQNLNRFSYVVNRPLKLVDPSGYFFGDIGDFFGGISNDVSDVLKNTRERLGDLGQAQIDLLIKAQLRETNRRGKKVFGDETWSTIVVTGATISVGAACAACAPLVSGAANGFVGSFLSVMIANDDFDAALQAGLRGAVIGGLSASLTYGVGSLADKAGGITASGEFTNPLLRYGVKVVGHGAIQGGIAELNGDNFKSGFYSGAYTSVSEPLIGIIAKDSKSSARIAAAIAGGTGAEIGGGKFINGAVSGVMVHMYNTERHTRDGLSSEDRDLLYKDNPELFTNEEIALATNSGGLIGETYGQALFEFTKLYKSGQFNPHKIPDLTYKIYNNYQANTIKYRILAEEVKVNRRFRLNLIKSRR